MTFKSFLVTAIVFIGCSALPLTYAAPNDDWADDSWDDETGDSSWQLSGFIEGAYGQFTQAQHFKSTDHYLSSNSLKELRTRVNLSYSHQSFDITVKSDLLFDDVMSENSFSDSTLKLREFNIKVSPFDFLDIKIGKQVLTWGTADYVFINDLFPKNWQSFFSGRDDEYLKDPSSSVKTSWYISDYTLDVVWTPKFTEDTFIRGERFSFYSPFLQQQIAPEKFDTQKTEKAQWFTRLSTTQQGVEYALYGYKGHWPSPEGFNENQLAYSPKMNAVGASLRTSLSGGIFNIEVVSYNSVESKKLNNNRSFTPHSQQRFLIGYETELMKNLTLNTQYYVEHTKNYSDLLALSPFPEQLKDKNRQLLTTRLTLSAMQQKLAFSLFNFYSPTDKDGYIKTSITYRQSDNWLYSVGANLFWGKEDFSFFGQHQTNSNIWGRVKYQF